MPPAKRSEAEKRERKTAQQRAYRKTAQERVHQNKKVDIFRYILPNAIRKTAVRKNITHDKVQDYHFRDQALQQLRQLLNSSRDTWGLFTASTVQGILNIAVAPTTNLDPRVSIDQAQALFLTTIRASEVLRSHPAIKVPIFGLGQQDFSWSARSRPISQLLAKYSVDDVVDVNIASLSRTGVSYSRKTIGEVQSRFKGNKDHNDGWNVLDLKNPLPNTYGICPKFLQNDNCDLLNRIKTAVLNPGWAGRIITKSKQKNEFREVEGWILLAEPGAYTGPHMDAYATETFINCNEGEIGIGWLDRPTDEQLESWAKDPSSYRGGTWCFAVLRAGMTVWFPAGFVHSVFRLSGDGRQTMGIGGHILRCFAIARWAKILALQLAYPNSTNEKVTKTAFTYLLVVLRLVRDAGAQGRLEEFGGEKNVAEFRQNAQDCHDILKRKYPRMNLEQLQKALGCLHARVEGDGLSLL
ncbi:uncharacterized protein BDZ99DRAFT_568134 [Mytilinidion resinicola]|uniref:JmjC domain-containing protein n=1 Tax=Mytilinidion resinicola TaxID=574789 RepID=A0A6A6YW76_9PEZI|nr:uncharacterized protein BDZ99DRAFT_568134 [Mytilinidion resinicola]KAF2812808.1 hypothetical protein BDZ99DRAFT_568134 [Mytilinidion resinicola]